MNQAAIHSPGSIDYNSLKHNLTRRPRNAHKGDFGHVLVVGGNAGFGGAALMAAEAAARVGAGLVSVATHPSHVAAFLSRRPELMVKGIENHLDLDSLLATASVIVIGPGLGQDDWSIQNLRKVIDAQTDNPVPLVVDADALNLISAGNFSDLTAY
ncbi:MAG: NAD(P)H-hydrate dehydratase, partial [Pseudohongiellaceae bacterium]